VCRATQSQLGIGDRTLRTSINAWRRRQRRLKYGTVSARLAGCPAASISHMADQGSEPGREPKNGRAPVDREALRCSFCSKAYTEVGTMVCGPTPSVAICNECVELCTEIMAEERGGPTRAA
jgi:hypothetical protein